MNPLIRPLPTTWMLFTGTSDSQPLHVHVCASPRSRTIIEPREFPCESKKVAVASSAPLLFSHQPPKRETGSLNSHRAMPSCPIINPEIGTTRSPLSCDENSTLIAPPDVRLRITPWLLNTS